MFGGIKGSKYDAKTFTVAVVLFGAAQKEPMRRCTAAAAVSAIQFDNVMGTSSLSPLISFFSLKNQQKLRNSLKFPAPYDKIACLLINQY